jgi:hypothetical protein
MSYGMREADGFVPLMGVRASYHQGALKIDGAEAAVLFDAKLDRLGDAVEAQVVFIRVYFIQQFALKLFELHFVDCALENGLLYSLADALAGLGDASQALAPGGCFSGNVVGNDDEHGLFRQIG